jgi:SAM-dependent methyltransferase
VPLLERALGYVYDDGSGSGSPTERDALATFDAVCTKKGWEPVEVERDDDGAGLDDAIGRMARREAQVLVLITGLPYGRRGDKTLYDRARREGWRVYWLSLGVEQGLPPWDRLEEMWTAEVGPLAGVPLPPAHLRRRVSGHNDASMFENDGAVFLRDAAAALRRQGIDFGAARSVLDFGCGPGRLLRHLPGLLPDAELTGVDVDPEPIAWLTANLPRVRAETVPELPPTDLPSGAFDLVIAYSVFSHLDAGRQDAWLEELARVMAPGGIGLITFHGDEAVRLLREHPLLELPPGAESDLESAGIAYWTGASDELPDWYGVALHRPAYLRSHWARWLDVLEVVPGGGQVTQDLAITRRPARRAR